MKISELKTLQDEFRMKRMKSMIVASINGIRSGLMAATQLMSNSEEQVMDTLNGYPLYNIMKDTYLK